MPRDYCASPLSRKGVVLIAHGLTAYSLDSIGYRLYPLHTGLFYLWYMSDRSPSLIPIEMATESVMSDEALSIDDSGIGTVIGALQGNSAVPDLNASTSAAPSLQIIFNPANISTLVSAPTLNVNQEHHTLYQQYIQVGETADQARAAVWQTEAEAERRHRAYA